MMQSDVILLCRGRWQFRKENRVMEDTQTDEI